MNDVLSFLVSKLQDPVIETYRSFIEALTTHLGSRDYALIMYGSCLSQTTKAQSSSPDFFVVVNDYATFYKKHPSHVFLNAHLPPNIYHFKVGNVRSKYSVVSLSHLIHQTSELAKDMYLLGRFSKRLAWISSNTTIQMTDIAKVQAQAMNEVMKKSLPLLSPHCSQDELCKMCIRLSYLGDVRVEASDKIDKLFLADSDFYRQAYSMLQTNHHTPALKAHEVHSFLARSRRRAKYRWPKAMITASNWLDYMLEKVERTQGLKIEMTPWERKLWFIYAWKYFFQLRKKNLIR